MAIIHTYFTASEGAVNLSEVGSWLQTNAVDIFDDIQVTDVSILCYIGENAAFCFDTSGNDRRFFTLANGASQTYYVPYFTEAYRTDCGFCLITDTVNYKARLFFTKSNNGNAAVAGYFKPSSGNTSYYYWYADLEKNTAFSHPHGSTVEKVAGASDALTTLTPVPLGDGGTYAPDLYLTAFTQYPNMRGVIEIDGVRYVYDGVIALKD